MLSLEKNKKKNFNTLKCPHQETNKCKSSREGMVTWNKKKHEGNKNRKNKRKPRWNRIIWQTVKHGNKKLIQRKRPPVRDTAEAPWLILVKDGICPQRGHQSECSVLKGGITQKAQQLPAIPSLPGSNGGTSGPLALYTQIMTYWERVVFPLIESGTKHAPSPGAPCPCAHFATAHHLFLWFICLVLLVIHVATPVSGLFF